MNTPPAASLVAYDIPASSNTDPAELAGSRPHDPSPLPLSPSTPPALSSPPPPLDPAEITTKPAVPEPASPGAFAFEELKADLREAHGLSLRALAVRGEVCPRAS